MKLVDPFVCCLDRLGLIHFAISSESLLRCMRHHLCKIVRVNSVEDVKEEIPVRAFRILVLIGEVDTESFVILQV